MPAVYIAFFVGFVFSVGFYFGVVTTQIKTNKPNEIKKRFPGHAIKSSHVCGFCGKLYNSDPVFAYHLSVDHNL